MATYDGTYQLLEGRSAKERPKRFRRLRRAGRAWLRALAAQPARLARFARDDISGTVDDLRKLAVLAVTLTARLQTAARDDISRTADDLERLANSLARLVGRIADLIARLARRLAKFARDDFSRTVDDLTTFARRLAELGRDDFNRTVDDLARLSAWLAARARDDISRTAGDLRKLAVLSRKLASRLYTAARDDFRKSADDLASLARWLGRIARDDISRTVDDLRKLAILSRTLAARVQAAARDDLSRTVEHIRRLAAVSMAIAARVAASARQLQAKAGQRLEQAGQVAARMQARTADRLSAVSARLEASATRLKVRTRNRLHRLGDHLLRLAGLPVRLAAHAVERGRHHRTAWGSYLQRRADARTKLAEQRAELKAAERWAKARIAEQRAALKVAGRQEKIKLAEEQARLKLVEQETREKLAEQHARMRLAEEQARLRLAEQQARTKLEEQARRKLAEQQARAKLEEQTRFAEQQARTKLEEQTRLAEEHARAKLAGQQAMLKQKEVAVMQKRVAVEPNRPAEERKAPADRPQQPAARPRRVLILVENLPSPFDRRVWQEASALRDAGYLVSIICPTGKGCEKKFEDIGGIHVWRYDLPFEARGAFGYVAEYATALAWTWILSWRVFFGRGFDAIHACNPPDLLFLIGGFFKLLGKKFLFDHHDINPELYEAKFGRRDFFYRLLVRFERWSFRTADVSIATNESYRQIAIERGGMPAERVFVVRSGPSLERMKIVPPEARYKRGRRYLVGYVGVMGKQEGIDCLLRAVRLIVARHGRTDVHFGLVGGGTSLEEMKTLATRLGIDDYVTFTGRVPDAEMLSLLNTADVCVNPDVPSEMNDKSTMNKVMEYMALGKPIVQFDLTEGRYSAREAASNARRGDIADFAARILELLDNAELRQRMGAAGRERVLNVLSWDHEVPRLLAAYECLWQTGKKSASLSEDIRGAMDTLVAPSAPPPAAP